MKRLLALPVATALLVAGCSSSGHHDSHSAAHGTTASTAASSGSSSLPAGPPAAGPHNEADAAFARDMIPHHRQAVEMVDMALATSKNTSVLAIARQIKAAQAPEIATMTGWLQGWNQPVPTGSEHDMGTDMDGMQHSGHSMMGMMSAAEMAELEQATGTAFDRMFLAMMVEHHRGAVSMARTELSDGQNAEVKDLARTIVATQTAEIATMTTLSAGR